jgi:enoyl-CoA hydratase/carnithine racemase
LRRSTSTPAASEHARFALTEVTLGIMPGAGGTQTLARAVGERRAKEIILTGKPFTAVEAQQWGIVNRVLPSMEVIPEALATADARLRAMHRSQCAKPNRP